MASKTNYRYNIGYKSARENGHEFVEAGNITEIINNSEIILEELARYYGEEDGSYQERLGFTQGLRDIKKEAENVIS